MTFRILYGALILNGKNRSAKKFHNFYGLVYTHRVSGNYTLLNWIKILIKTKEKFNLDFKCIREENEETEKRNYNNDENRDLYILCTFTLLAI